jgi:ribosomal protein S27E
MEYRVVLICNNCEKERIVYIESGIPIWLWLIFDTGKCSNCENVGFRKALFQNN